jgi:hypothetical protein
MQRPRRRERVVLPLFDQAGSVTAPPLVVDLDELHRLTCIRYGVTPTGRGLPARSTRFPLKCEWPQWCPFLSECGCALTDELRAQLRGESRP